MVSSSNGNVLTKSEMSILENLLKAHDRVGFYIAYQAMFDSDEASLQARISTFSGIVGETALGSNRLLQVTFGSEDYPGIYKQSQIVANLPQAPAISSSIGFTRLSLF